MSELVVLITVPSRLEAARIGRHLVRQRLAACVNILPQVTSWFWWPDLARKNRVQTAREALLIVKTRRDRFRALERTVKALHRYTVPEVIALPIVAGSEAYLAWVRKEARRTGR